MPSRTLRLHASLAVSVSALAATLAQGAQPGQDQRLETVNIVGERTPAELEAERALTPGAVDILDGERFHERSVTQLADVFRYVPGVWAESYNGNDEVFYSSRGSNLDSTDYDKNGVNYLQDGLPVTAADGNNHNRALDPLSARHVVVAHGANALAYGASTLGGAVDFISHTAHTTAPFSASASVGSFGQFGGRATLGGVSGSLDGLLAVETQQRDGYREHSKQDRKNAYANFGWQSSDNVATRFYATWSDYDIQLPRELTRAEYEADPRQARPEAIDGDHGKHVKAWRLAARTTVAGVGGGTLELGLSFEQQDLFHPIVSPPPGETGFSLLIDTRHKDTGAMLRWRREAGDHGLLIGANYGSSKMNGGNYSNDGGEPGFLMWTTDDDASTLELFALDRWKFAPRWTLVYGTQFVSADRLAGGFEGDYNAFNPRLGVVFNIDEGSEWFASLSRIYEAPTTFELTDDTTGDNNPLDAMHGVVFETGVRGSTMRGDTRLHWSLTGYYTALRDEILSVADPDEPWTSLSVNVDKTIHAGIEALFGASHAIGAAHRIEPLVSATLNEFTFDSDGPYEKGDRLPAAPRFFLRGELLYRHASGFFAGPTFDLVGKRFADFGNSYRLESYELLGARAGITGDGWEVYAEGRNLLDKNYIATASTVNQADADAQILHPGAPRSVYVGARFRF